MKPLRTADLPVLSAESSTVSMLGDAGFSMFKVPLTAWTLPAAPTLTVDVDAPITDVFTPVP